ncbi:MAG: DUF4340 domain-containing protein [Magnetococcales bacterium]|nr:DUF4340 domain-containing protein [Magnetococcales bacterium]
MAKGWWINLFLLLLLIGGGGGVWWIGQMEEVEEALLEEARQVSPIAPQEVIRVRLTNRQQQVIALMKEARGWRITEPVQLVGGADSDGVAALLGVLDQKYDRRIVEEVRDAASFGLIPPQARLSVATARGQSQTLTLGEESPAGGKRYLLLGDDGPLVLLPKGDLLGLELSINQLRDKRLFADFEGKVPQRVRLEKGGDVQLVLEKKGDGAGGWWLQEPFVDRAGDQAAGAWVNDFTLAMGSDFKAGSPPEGDGWVMTLTDQMGHSRRVTFWLEGEQLLARRSGETDALTLFSHLTENLAKSPLDFISHHPLDILTTPEQLILAFQGRRLRVSPTAGQWPNSHWETIWKSLVQEAWKGVESKGVADPWLMVTVDVGGKRLQVPFWKEGALLRLAPPGRPRSLLLTVLQSQAMEKAMVALFNGKAP